MRKKAAIAALLALLLCFAPVLKDSNHNAAIAQTEIQVIVEGKELLLETPAFIEKGTTLVPVREVAEALGATVTYNETADGKGTVGVQRGERIALVTIGSASMIANGREVTLAAAPRIAGQATMVPLRAISEALGDIVVWDGVRGIVTIDKPRELPTIGTGEQLVKLLQSIADRNSRIGYHEGIRAEATAGGFDFLSGSAPALDAGGAANKQEGSGGDYSSTNVQVSGVDEADWAKTDGRFIYQISGSRVLIADIANPAGPKLAAVLEYDGQEGFYPQELYVDEGRLIVIGQKHQYYLHAEEGAAGSQGDSAQTSRSPAVERAADAGVGDIPAIAATPMKRIAIWPPMNYRSAIKTLVYELNEAGQPALTRELMQEGSYLSSRKIGNALYIVTNKYNNMYPMYDAYASAQLSGQEAEAVSEQLTSSVEPIYGDSSVSGDMLTLPLDSIHYFPEPADSSMMLVGAIDLDQPSGQMQLSAYMGSGSTVYASQKHLYVALSGYKLKGKSYEQETKFHKFRLDYGQVVYIGEGTVPGALLNQFSMDEHEGYFRVALTNGDMWATGEAGSTNNLYVLDERLSVVGKLEGLAPGERIYSARFMGDRAYMVTFRNVDPLFAIDLRQPTNPSVLGELKIPGFSDYLHPYDDNHIIGFGKDTVEVPSMGNGPDDTVALLQGMKIALFDVTDVHNPKEKFKEIIGDRGTGSELLYNHKALLFSKDKNLMAFPVELYEFSDQETGSIGDGFADFRHGHFRYQGAYVYGIDLEKGFQLRGRISHLSDEELNRNGYYGYDYLKSVRRILYAGDTLYTLSEAMLKANSLNNLDERGVLSYPSPPAGHGHTDIGIMPVEPMR